VQTFPQLSSHDVWADYESNMNNYIPKVTAPFGARIRMNYPLIEDHFNIRSPEEGIRLVCNILASVTISMGDDKSFLWSLCPRDVFLVKNHRDSNKTEKDFQPFTWKIMMEYIGKSFLGQFDALPPQSPKVPPRIRIYLIVWLFSSFLVSTFYLSMLVEFLTFPVLTQGKNLQPILISKWG
jgi:hypothetical protein